MVQGLESRPSQLVPTPVRANRLGEVLVGYSEGVVDHLVQGFSEGFHLGYVGSGALGSSKNLKSASDHPQAIQDYIEKELKADRLAGPFEHPPFQNFTVSPIGVVPKKSGKFRFIQHLSYPLGNSINSGIPDDKASVQYASTDEAIRLISSAGKGAWLVKLDIKCAFKIVPVHPDDYHLLGFKWSGKYYFDKTLPMGCRSSCQIFESFSSALEWVARRRLKILGVTHILDDYLLICVSEESGHRAKHDFEDLCGDLGVPLAPEKLEGPAQCLTYIGIEFDTILMEARLPPDKLSKARSKIQDALGKAKITLKELQSIIGLLNFCNKVVRPGRAFLRRLINLTIGVSNPHHHIRLTHEAKADLYTWLIFLTHFNGKSLFLSQEWVTAAALHLYTDASGALGYGAVFGSKWFFGKWPNHWAGQNITLLEMFPIVAAVVTWAPMLRNSKLILHTDNMALVHILNATSSKDAKVMKLVRKFVLACLFNNVQIRVEHVKGINNILADKLSRLQVDSFRSLAPWADKDPCAIPYDIQPQNWFLG